MRRGRGGRGRGGERGTGRGGRGARRGRGRGDNAERNLPKREDTPEKAPPPVSPWGNPDALPVTVSEDVIAPTEIENQPREMEAEVPIIAEPPINLKKSNRGKWGMREVLQYLREQVKEEFNEKLLVSPSATPAQSDQIDNHREYFFIDMESLHEGIPNKEIHQLLYGDLLPTAMVILLIKGNLKDMLDRGRLVKVRPASTDNAKQHNNVKKKQDTTRTPTATTSHTTDENKRAREAVVNTAFRSRCGGCDARISAFPLNSPQRLIVSTEMVRRAERERKGERRRGGGRGRGNDSNNRLSTDSSSSSSSSSARGGFDYTPEYLMGLLPSFLVEELMNNLNTMQSVQRGLDGVSARRDIFLIYGHHEGEEAESGGGDAAAVLNELIRERQHFLNILSEGIASSFSMDIRCHELRIPGKESKSNEVASWDAIRRIELVAPIVDEPPPPADEKKRREEERKGREATPMNGDGPSSLDRDTEKAIARAEKWLHKNRDTPSLPRTPISLHESLTSICRLKKTLHPEIATEILRKFGLVDVCKVCGLLSYSPDLPARVKNLKASDVGVDDAAQAAFRLMVRLAETEREQLPSTVEGLLTRIRQFGCYEIQLNPQVVIEALTKRGLIKLVEKRKEGVIVSQQVVYQIQPGPKQMLVRV